MKTVSVLNFKMHFLNLFKWVKGIFHKISSEKLIERKLGTYNNMEGYWMTNDFNETSQKEFPN